MAKLLPFDHSRRAHRARNASVDDIEAVVASLHAGGVETSAITRAVDAEGEGRFARLQDPEGHRIELWQHLEAADEPMSEAGGQDS